MSFVDVDDWWPEGWDGIDPPGVLAGFDGAPARVVPHRGEPQRGWKCSCGAPTMGPTQFGQGIDYDHQPVVDVDLVADPTTPLWKLHRWPVWSAQVLQAFLDRGDLDHQIRLDLVGRCQYAVLETGMPDRHALAVQLLTHPGLAFTSEELRGFTRGQGVRDTRVAAALLAHPAADASVLTELVRAAAVHRYGAENAATVLRWLEDHDDPRIRTATRMWTTVDTARWAGDDSGTGNPHAVFTAAVLAIDTRAPHAWTSVGALFEQFPLPLHQFGQAAAGALAA